MCANEAVIRNAIIATLVVEVVDTEDAWKQKERDEARITIFKRAAYEEQFRRFDIPVPTPIRKS